MTHDLCVMTHDTDISQPDSTLRFNSVRFNSARLTTIRFNLIYPWHYKFQPDSNPTFFFGLSNTLLTSVYIDKQSTKWITCSRGITWCFKYLICFICFRFASFFILFWYELDLLSYLICVSFLFNLNFHVDFILFYFDLVWYLFWFDFYLIYFILFSVYEISFDLVFNWFKLY